MKRVELSPILVKFRKNVSVQVSMSITTWASMPPVSLSALVTLHFACWRTDMAASLTPSNEYGTSKISFAGDSASVIES